jgi:23S rRNA (guanine2445-N2)-methyltransferase / 23S rRNA (guanine2069-N7)-methyltransferase
MSGLRFYVTCAVGLEELAAGEISRAGGTVQRLSTGRLGVTGSLETAYRLCLWSRFSSRVVLRLARFAATNGDEIYEGARKIRWREHIDPRASFAVNARIDTNRELNHSNYAALRIKDAVADYFRDRVGYRPSVRAVRPDVQLILRIAGGSAEVGVDLAGESLHRRGYRTGAHGAPLKESLAAAIVAMSGWRMDEPLVDPFCGSATLLIEAAMMACDTAPGLYRSYFGLLGWAGHRADLWRSLISEATQRKKDGGARRPPPLLGYDGDPEMVKTARHTLARAGFGNKIEVAVGDCAFLQVEADSGLVVCNPPYGNRMIAKRAAGYLYRGFGERLSEQCDGWRLGFFTGLPECAEFVGVRWRKKIRLQNGPLSCRLFVGKIERRSKAPFHPRLAEGLSPPDGETHSARTLRDTIAHRFTWARLREIECFRCYDGELPGYDVRLEWYRKYMVVSERADSQASPPASNPQPMAHMVNDVRTLLGLSRDQVILARPRRPDDSRPPRLYEAGEQGGIFLLDFASASSFGLPLEQRELRAKAAAVAAGKRCLHLYSGTGVLGVLALRGGAHRWVGVEPDPELHGRAELNRARNGLSEKGLELIQEECLAWLGGGRSCFDLIIVDGTAAVFDEKMDHLIMAALGRLEAGGMVWFWGTRAPFAAAGISATAMSISSCSGLVPDDCRPQPLPVLWQISTARESPC